MQCRAFHMGRARPRPRYKQLHATNLYHVSLAGGCAGNQSHPKRDELRAQLYMQCKNANDTACSIFVHIVQVYPYRTTWMNNLIK